MRGGRGSPEVLLEIGLGWRATFDFRVVVNASAPDAFDGLRRVARIVTARELKRSPGL